MRKSAIFIILFLLLTGVTAAEEHIIDNDNGAPEYTQSGDWTLSESSGYDDGQYWYTADTREPSHCIWTPEILTADTYEVSILFRRSTNRTTDAPFTVFHAGGSDTFHIDQYGANAIVEIYLGEFYFNTGTSGYIRLDNNGGAGIYISDAARFVTAVDDLPVITKLRQTPPYPTGTDTVSVTANVTDDHSIASVILHYSSVPSGASGSVTAFDDGVHDDGAAGDNVFGAAIPSQPDGDTVTYYYSATDDIAQTSDSSNKSYTVGETPRREYRSVWVDSWGTGILNAAECDELIQTCRDNNLNSVMVEIRKIGDACYNSNLEPRATNITGGPTFDPLGYLLSLAHDTSGGKEYIEVHGWFCMQRLSRLETLDPQHVLAQYPEYTMANDAGETIKSASIYMDPGHPDAVDHNVAVIQDCLQNYSLDGINLDYIRYPGGANWGYNSVSVARFNDFFARSGQPLTSDPDWADWRRECMTLQVKKVYVKSLMIDWDVVLSICGASWGSNFSTFENTSAYTSVFQDWGGWLDQGIIDYAAPMNYTTDNTQFEGWINLSQDHDTIRGTIMGMGAGSQLSIQDSMDKLLFCRNAETAGTNIYDWYGEVTHSTGTRAEFYDELKNQLYPTWVDTPEHSWKSSPATGIFEGNLSDGVLPIDHGTVMIDGQPETMTYTDGSGWYAILNVTPGPHLLRFSKPGYLDELVPGDIPSAGNIVTVNASLISSIKEWEK